jgi:hypothetical protein
VRILLELNEVRMFARKFLFPVMALMLAFLGPLAQATTLTELSVEQMTDASDLIVRGTVTQVFTELDERGNVWTRAQVEVSEVLKGDTDTRAVLVDQMGGVHGNSYSVIRWSPRFSKGEEAVFFLETLRSGKTSIVGWYQGKFTLRMDPDAGEVMLVRFTTNQDRPYNHRFLPHPPVQNRIYLSDFETRVRDRVLLGWDGRAIPGADPAKLRRINHLQQGVK